MCENDKQEVRLQLISAIDTAKKLEAIAFLKIMDRQCTARYSQAPQQQQQQKDE